MSGYANRIVLVTGGAGMIGIQVVRRLLAQGARVRVADLADPSRLGPMIHQVDYRLGSLLDPDFCAAVVHGVQDVFHVAGIKGSTGIGRKRAASFFVPLILMNTQLMEAARRAGVERLLYTSSIGVYPPKERFVESEAWDGPPHQADRYAAWAKRMGELQAEAYREEYGWDRIAIVRPANVYGPYDNFDPNTAMVIPALIARVLAGENPLRVWGDGSAIRDFIYSEDVAEGMLLALDKAARCIPINLGSGQGASIREVVETILRHVDHPPEVVWDTSRPTGQPIRLMDTQRAETLLGFRPRVSLDEGIRQTIAWYQTHRHLNEKRYDVFRDRQFAPRPRQEKPE